jgi:DNA-binding XRE family transcriptional regulator
MPESVSSLSHIDRRLTKLGSKVRETDVILSAPQVRAARSLLGWSRRELAIVSGVSPGTIKALELDLTDPRLSTLRKLARTFKAHDVAFLFEGRWTGVVIAMPPVSDQRKVRCCIPGEDHPGAISPSASRSKVVETIYDVNSAGAITKHKPLARWFGAHKRPKTA